MDLALNPLFEHMAQHRLQRREPRAAGDENQGRGTCSIDELPDGPSMRKSAPGRSSLKSRSVKPPPAT